MYLCSVKTATIIANLLLLSSLPLALGMQNSSPTPTPTPANEERPKPRQKLRVSSGVAEGLILHKVNPRYPEEARKKHIQGEVTLLFTIDKEGSAINLEVAQGDPLLAQAAIDAVKQWKYKPFLLNGEPVEVETMVRINFHL